MDFSCFIWFQPFSQINQFLQFAPNKVVRFILAEAVWRVSFYSFSHVPSSLSLDFSLMK